MNPHSDTIQTDAIYTSIGRDIRLKSDIKMIYVDTDKLVFYQIVNSMNSEYSYSAFNLSKTLFLMRSVDFGEGFIAALNYEYMMVFIVLSYKTYNKLYDCNYDDLFTV